MGLLEKRDLTQAEKVTAVREQLVDVSTKLYQRMEKQHTYIFNQIWHNDEVSAQEVFDEYGNDAYQLFAFSQNIQTMLAQANPSYVPLVPPYDYTINPDGTVTVNDEDPSTFEGDVS